MKLPQATPAAEHLKAVVQEVLSMFQTGAGINDGMPCPMTFELAVKTLWREIDKVFYQQWPKDSVNRVSMRIQGAGKLPLLLGILNESGEWSVRSTVRNEVTVAHVTGVIRVYKHPVAALVHLLRTLDTENWTVSDLALGAA